MDDNVMEGQAKYDERGAMIPEGVIRGARQLGSRVAHAAGDRLGRVADVTEMQVKKYPLAAIGIACGAGVLLGIGGTLLVRPRPPTFRERLHDLELGSRLAALYKKIF